MKYFVYMLRCEDGSVYTGITTDMARRWREHTGTDGKGAKYTRRHPPVKVLSLWQCEGRGAASRLEYRIKQLPKPRKEELAQNGDLSLFAGVLPVEQYQYTLWEET